MKSKASKRKAKGEAAYRKALESVVGDIDEELPIPEPEIPLTQTDLEEMFPEDPPEE